MGAAIVARLREAGADVMTTARTMPSGYPTPKRFVTADVSTAEGAQTVINEVQALFGTLDILVHTVGGSGSPVGGFRSSHG